MVDEATRAGWLEAAETIREHNEITSRFEKEDDIKKFVNSVVNRMWWSNEFAILNMHKDGLDVLKNNKRYRLTVTEIE